LASEKRDIRIDQVHERVDGSVRVMVKIGGRSVDVNVELVDQVGRNVE